MKFVDFFQKFIFKREEKNSDINVEELRTEFKARYHNFKLLLNSNNKALEIMTNIQKALFENLPFGMSFIRVNYTALSVNVFKIIKNLDELAPKKYKELFSRFKDIQTDINNLIAQRHIPKSDKLIIHLESVDKNMIDIVGGKMANLGEIKNKIHLPVPNGFVITSLVYRKFFEYDDLKSEINRYLQCAKVEDIESLYNASANIQKLIINADIPHDIEQEIINAYSKLENKEGKEVKIALRSSALQEDTGEASFAGQYSTKLNVKRDNIIATYKEIIASKYSLPAITYTLTRGINDEDISMCVGCMEMVHSISGGVLYSRNPLNIRDNSIFINSVWGLGSLVVDGSIEPDLFVVSRENSLSILKKNIKEKPYKFVCYPEEGICRMDLTGGKRFYPSLNNEQVIELAKMAIKLEEYYDSPQDIEWAIGSNNAIYILQSRPLKQIDTGEKSYHFPDKKLEKELVILHGGVTASPGVAAGQVFIVKKDIDMLLFPDGAILVTSEARPRWATILSRALAIVAEHGSVTGHLANVAREYGIPALFGVSRALEKLKNGDLITVNTNTLTIYKGKIEELLKEVGIKRNFMEGSPIYNILKGIMEYITPLNLINPDSPEFRANFCKTFHDITRFCHEKAIQEMFDSGKNHHFPERSSKQLLYNVPMQWWIINLDDGFKEEVTGKYVKLDNITSIPMLSLWKGITAIPWEGPPPVDSRGFMSILVEATANPDIVAFRESQYINRNYFMISKNFCILNSRFGFHFSIIESLVSERATENYIRFQFKGGAADSHRRCKRAVFVGDILEEFGFAVRVLEDALFARIREGEEEFIKKRLEILGYLIIHTRQLDMIMSNIHIINKYKEKILKDIEYILSRGQA